MTNRRESLLLGIIAGLALLYALRFLGDRLVVQPLRLQRLQSEQLQREIRQKHQQIQTLRDAEQQLAVWRKSSLPPNVAVAQTQYEHYLFDLVQQHGVENWVVEPGTVFEDEQMTRLPFRVTGQISLGNLTGMLHQIYQTRLLHRIRRLDLQRTNDSDQDVRMVLSIEGISVRGAAERTELIPAELADGGPLDGKPLAAFGIVAEKNILTPHRETFRSSPAMGEDVASGIHLTGTPYWGDSRQAWLHDRRTDASWILEDGQQFELGGVSGTVVGIGDSHVELEIDGRRWMLRLNRHLREITALD